MWVIYVPFDCSKTNIKKKWNQRDNAHLLCFYFTFIKTAMAKKTYAKLFIACVRSL